MKGPRVYGVNRGKEVIAFREGSRDLTQGMKIIIAHIDAPRLDLKQNPLYEDVDLALLRTHYYGGIKKYQWVAMPLAIHGVVVKADGTLVNFVIGEDERDPVFSIDDLLPHLSRKHQDEKKLSEAIEGEKLTVLFGSMPLLGEEREPVKKAVLGLLREQYGIEEEDFISAEIEVVPAFKARDVGIDRSMVGAYGQDDRASAYPLLAALADLDEEPSWPVLAVFIDKEEIGSEGNTSAQSHFIQMFLQDLIEGLGLGNAEALIRRAAFQVESDQRRRERRGKSHLAGSARETECLLSRRRDLRHQVHGSRRQGGRERRPCRIRGRDKEHPFKERRHLAGRRTGKNRRRGRRNGRKIPRRVRHGYHRHGRPAPHHAFPL